MPLIRHLEWLRKATKICKHSPVFNYVCLCDVIIFTGMLKEWKRNTGESREEDKEEEERNADRTGKWHGRVIRNSGRKESSKV